MARTIYLHIGHFKTGTTALQHMLSHSEKALRRAGLDYVAAGRFHNKHSYLGFSVLRDLGVTELMHGYAQPGAAADHWAQVFEAARQSNAPAVLASTEELIRLGAHDGSTEILRDIIAPVRDEFTFRIIVYLRPLRSHLRSWYNQLVKMNVRPVPAFEAAVCDVMEPVHYDYALALRPWMDVFGAEALIVRPYTDALRSGDALYQDFLSIFGIEVPKRLQLPQEDPNPRQSDDLLEVTRIMQTAQARAADVERAQRQAALRQDAVTARRGLSVAQLEAQARQGVDQIDAWFGDVAPWGDMLKDLPDASLFDARKDIENLEAVLAFLLYDMKTLRENLHSRQAELLRRIEALEAGQSTPKS